MKRIEALQYEAAQKERENEEKAKQERFKAVLEGDWIEELERTDGWKLMKREIFDKGLTIQRFLGCRSGKLIWMQGFMAALDTINRFMETKKRIKEQIVKEERGGSE